MTIYAERSRSVLIGALTHHPVPLGYISTYTAKSWDQMLASLRDQSLFFSNSTDWAAMSLILRQEAADLLLIDTADAAMSPEKIRAIFTHSRHIVSIRSYQAYDLTGQDLELDLEPSAAAIARTARTNGDGAEPENRQSSLVESGQE
jgi:hypothetical protein